MASSSGPDFLLSGNCAQCAKMGTKEFHCPMLAGRGHSNLAGLSVHPQLINRSAGHCCPQTLQPLCPAFPIRLNSFCSCPQCSAPDSAIDRRVPLPHHPNTFFCNSHWLSPVEVQNSGFSGSRFIAAPLPSQPCMTGHPGMTVDGMPVNTMPGLSYHHHHHYHHFHYHNHPHSRNNLHPYALPVFHPRLRRQPGVHRSSRHGTEDDRLPHNLLSILTPTRVTWEEAGLNTEQLENVVSYAEQLDPKPRGLSKAIVENLPSYRITSKDNVSELRCVICLMDFEEKHQVRILPCSHEYHSKCIDKWLKSNRTCPICRKEIKIC